MINLNWKNVEFEDIFKNKRKKNRIIGLTFPAQDQNLGLEPSILSVLPQGDSNVEYSMKNIEFNDDDVEYYLCSVYISGLEEFQKWAQKHDKSKIIVGGYHPTTFPEDFKNYASKIVIGICDDFYETIKQEGQIVKGIVSNKNIPRYDLYDIKVNQQIIPDKKPNDVCTSISTSQGCPYACDFCCSPIMSNKVVSKPIEQIKKEIDYLKQFEPKFCFIRDENFPLQKDWKERLKIINQLGAKIYLFASSNLLQKEENVKFLSENGVYMVCLGLEDVTKSYGKNKNMKNTINLLKKYNIMTYLSFIVNPLEIIGKEKGENYYNLLMKTFEELKPEMVTGNFLMPFRGTKLWDEYYAFVSKDDYKYYDSKTPFLIKNKLLKEKMQFFMFYYQWKYYTSNFYNKNVRKFECKDTLHLRFEELKKEFEPKYLNIWNKRV